jgi:hypothetical protein
LFRSATQHLRAFAHQAALLIPAPKLGSFASRYETKALSPFDNSELTRTFRFELAATDIQNLEPENYLHMMRMNIESISEYGSKISSFSVVLTRDSALDVKYPKFSLLFIGPDGVIASAPVGAGDLLLGALEISHSGFRFALKCNPTLSKCPHWSAQQLLGTIPLIYGNNASHRFKSFDYGVISTKPQATEMLGPRLQISAKALLPNDDWRWRDGEGQIW